MPDPKDYQISKLDLSKLFYDRSIDNFDIELSGNKYSFNRTTSHEKGTFYAYSCDPDLQDNAYILRSIFQGDPITITFQNSIFCNEVADYLKLDELKEYCQKFIDSHQETTECENVTRKIGHSIFSFFKQMGTFGKSLLFLWDLTGVAFIMAFIINMTVLIATSGISILSRYPINFFIVMLPLMAYSLYMVNIINVAVVELSELRIFSERTVWSKHQFLIMRLIKMTPLGSNIKRDYIFKLGDWYDVLKGLVFMLFVLVFLAQAVSEHAGQYIEYFIYLFAVLVSPIKYGLIYPLYVFHAIAGCFRYCRNRFREIADFSDPFLNSIYFRNHPYQDLWKRISCCSNTDEEVSESSIPSDSEIQEDNIEKEEKDDKTEAPIIKKKQPFKFYFWRAFFSRETSSLFIIVSLTVYIIVKYYRNGLKMNQFLYIVFIFDLIVIPLCMWMPLPMFWWRRHTGKILTQNNLREQLNSLKITKKFQTYTYDLVTWGDEFNRIRWISVIFTFLMFFLLFTSVFVAVGYNRFIHKTNKNIILNNSTGTSLHSEDFRLITNSICYAKPKEMSILQLSALCEAAYYDYNDFGNFSLFMTEFFGSSWNSTILYEDTKSFNATYRGYMRKFTFTDKKLVIFAIRGTAELMDALADAELWFGSVVLDLVLPFVPFLDIYSDISHQHLGTIMSVPRFIFPQWSLIDGYVKEFETYIKSQTINDDHDVLIVGHSLGGGLSKILSLTTGYQAVSVSGPGVRSVLGFYKTKYQSMEQTFVNINPDQDFVALVDSVTGSLFQVPCRAGFINCHSLTRTLCMISIMCGEYEIHKDYCTGIFSADSITDMINLGKPTNISL